MVKVIYFKSSDEIFQKFNNYEISPCQIVERDSSGEIIYEQCGFDSPDIAIWCVYGHLRTGGLECISDHDTFEDAEEYKQILPILDA